MDRVLTANVVPVIATLFALGCIDDQPVAPLPADRAEMAGSSSATIGHPRGQLIENTPVSARPFGLDISPQGTIYVTRLDADAIAISDTRSRRITGGFSVGRVPTGVDFSPDGHSAYVTNQYSNNVGVIDVGRSAQVATIGLGVTPFVVRVAPDGGKIYISNSARAIRVASTSTRTVIDRIPVGSVTNGLAVHPGGELLYASSLGTGTVAEIRTQTDQILRRFSPGGSPQELVVSRKGGELYIANEAGWLDFYDLASGRRVKRLQLAGGGFGLALSPSQARLYVTIPSAGLVQVVDIPNRQVVRTITVGGIPRRVAFNADGSTAVVANEDGYISFIQ